MLNKRSYVDWQFLRSKENLRQEEKNYLWNIFINKIMGNRRKRNFVTLKAAASQYPFANFSTRDQVSGKDLIGEETKRILISLKI